MIIFIFSASFLVAGAALAVDHQGQKFQISPTSLVKPYATPAAGNEPATHPCPAGTMPEVPKDLAVSILAD